jgi:DNA polymerase/3'-5' exonuclease PolX
MSDGGLAFERQVALGTAQELMKVFAPAVHKMEIAGSIRREVKYVHDIDLVAWPKYEDIGQPVLFGEGSGEMYPSQLVDLVKQYADMMAIGPKMDEFKPGGKIIKFERCGIPVEIYLVEPDGSNWGALLQCRTGSAEFNRRLATEAIKLGLRYSAGYGLYEKPGVRMDDDTEEDILRQLGISEWYLDPTRRQS